MPDYSACTNALCELREKCARFRMVWSEYQAVSGFPGGKDCHGFIDVEDAPFRVREEND